MRKKIYWLGAGLIFTGFGLYFAMYPAENIIADTAVAPRLADRAYIASRLIDVFGDSAAPVLKQEVLNKIDVFGGPCDPDEEFIITAYTESGVEGRKANETTGCPHGLSDGKASFTPKDNLLRKTAIYYVCEQMAIKDSTLSKSLAFENQGGLPAFTEENKKKVYKKFYPFEEPTVDLSAELKNTPDLKQKWQKFVVTVCASPGWQTL